MIYLHKILPFFLSPLGMVFIFLTVSFFYKRRFFVFLAFITLVISSNPFIANYLMQKLEYPYNPIPISSVKESDAIVVLSGIINQVGTKKYSIYEFTDPDRFIGGLDLIKQQKADKLIFTAGEHAGRKSWVPEGYILKKKAISLGVSGQILVTENVKNTYEESIAVTKLIPNNSSVILVTSAFHMHRSKYLFENQGFKVTPFPVDFKYEKREVSLLSFLPDVYSLNLTSRFIRENIGRLYYKLFL